MKTLIYLFTLALFTGCASTSPNITSDNIINEGEGVLFANVECKEDTPVSIKINKLGNESVHRIAENATVSFGNFNNEAVIGCPSNKISAIILPEGFYFFGTIGEKNVEAQKSYNFFVEGGKLNYLGKIKLAKQTSASYIHRRVNISINVSDDYDNDKVKLKEDYPWLKKYTTTKNIAKRKKNSWYF